MKALPKTFNRCLCTAVVAVGVVGQIWHWSHLSFGILVYMLQSTVDHNCFMLQALAAFASLFQGVFAQGSTWLG